MVNAHPGRNGILANRDIYLQPAQRRTDHLSHIRLVPRVGALASCPAFFGIHEIPVSPDGAPTIAQLGTFSYYGVTHTCSVQSWSLVEQHTPV